MFVKRLNACGWWLLLGSLCHCSNERSFNAPYLSQTTLSDPNALPSTLAFAELMGLQLPTLSSLKSQGVRAGDIATLQLASFTLRVVQPNSNQDLTFLQSVEVFWGDPNDASATHMTLAQGEAFPIGLTLVGLTVTDVDLNNLYQAHPQQGLRLAVRSNYNVAQPLSNPVTLEAAPTFHVTTSMAQPFWNVR